MWKLAFLFHIFLWPLFVSVPIVGVILTPSCQGHLELWLAISAIGGFVVSTPASVYAAKASAKLGSARI